MSRAKRNFAFCCALSIGFLALWDFFSLRTIMISGPVSSLGYGVSVEVSDIHFSPGADYYADVRVRNSKKQEILCWRDPSGQNSWHGARKLASSIRWTSPTSLEFQCASGELVKLKVPNSDL